MQACYFSIERLESSGFIVVAIKSGQYQNKHCCYQHIVVLLSTSACACVVCMCVVCVVCMCVVLRVCVCVCACVCVVCACCVCVVHVRECLDISHCTCAYMYVAHMLFIFGYLSSS